MGNCQKQEEQERDESNNDHLGPVEELRISAYTWGQQYQGLFDYDTKQVQKSTLIAKGAAILINNKNLKGKEKNQNYQISNQQLADLSEQKLKQSLFRIIRKNEYYQISPIFVQQENSINVQRLLWLVIQSLSKQKHIIQENDIIKLGKQKIRIRQIALPQTNPVQSTQKIKLSKNVYEKLVYNPHPQSDPLKIVGKQSAQSTNNISNVNQLKGATSEITDNDQQLVCRICLQSGEYQNPLITPCKCIGSVKYIHLACLRTWLAKRIKVQKTAHCVTINWMQLTCQMCKSPFKYRIYMDNKKFYTVQIPKPPKPYIILQLMRRNSGIHGKIFHFVSFANKCKIMLGRRKDIDVRISQDISISRAHACIQYFGDRKQFQISDNKSKFGTLVLIKKGLLIWPTIENKNISLQIGSSVYRFEAIRGPSRPEYNIQLESKKQEAYLAQSLSDQDIEENEDDQLNSVDNGDENEQLQQIVGVSHSGQNSSGLIQQI